MRRGRTPLGAAHATAYVHATDLTAAATNHQALRPRHGHMPVQRRLRIRKERLFGIAILPLPCLLCVGQEETPVHMHADCAHSRLLLPHYRQAVQEGARHPLPGNKALWVTLWRFAAAEWTEVFCSGLVPEEAEAELRAIARYDPPGATSLHEFLQHSSGRGISRWSSTITGWSNSSARPTARRPGYTDGSLRRRATAPPSPASQQGLRGLPPPGERHSGVSHTRGAPPLPGPAWRFLKASPGHALPTVDHWTHFHDRMGSAHRGRGVGAQLGPVVPDDARTGNSPTAVCRRPTRGRGPHTRLRSTLIVGVGPERPWDAATMEWLQAAPEHNTGWRSDVSSLLRAPLPPRLVSNAANLLRAAEIHTWGCDAAIVRWLPPEDGGARLTLAHLKKLGPTYDDGLCRLGNVPGPLLLMLPTELAAALRRELDSCNELKVRWVVVADDTLLDLPRRGTVEGSLWNALVSRLSGRHTYMTTPQWQPRPVCDDLIAGFHDRGILPEDTWQAVRQKTLGRDHRSRVRARLFELRGPLCQRWDDLWLCRLDSWSPASHLPHTCHLCGECNPVSCYADGHQQVRAVLPGGRVPLA